MAAHTETSPGLAVASVALLVDDYDRAKAWFETCLGFKTVSDSDLGGGKRWVAVAPPGGRGARLVLAKASGPEQAAAIGRQFAGRVGLFLETRDFDATHARMLAAGVGFRERPREEPYGRVAVFEDLYGNAWDLIGPPPDRL